MALFDLDSQLFLAINAFARATPWMWPALTAYAIYGPALFAALTVAGWWIARRERNRAPMIAAIWTPLGVLAALAANQPIADALGQPRPYTRFADILVLVPHTLDPALPSDHAVMAGATCAGLFLVNRRLGWYTGAAAVAIAFARIYVAAHFPLDVLTGLLLGAAISLLGHQLLRPLLARAVALLAATRLQPLLTAPPDRHTRQTTG